MCVVSVMHDYMRTNVPFDQWTRPLFSEYQEIIRRLGELDEKLNQRDCEDPAKAVWIREIETRLEALESNA